MADFSFLSDTDDSAVEELISQARDLCVLEQVAAINCSGLVDSVLPTDLESRFSRLKSFPTTAQSNHNPKASLHAFASARHGTRVDDEGFSPAKQNPAGKKLNFKSEPQSKGEPKRGSVSFSSNSSSDSSPRSANVSKGSFDKKKRFNSRLESRSISIASNSSSEFSPKSANASKRSFDKKKRFGSSSRGGSSSWNSSRESLSPPRKPGCFWCSPKKGSSARKSKEDWTSRDDFGWSKNEELLADLGSFPIKEQRKILKQAMVEQKKISLEAQKILKLAKQQSSKMNVSRIEDELSDD